MFTARYEGKPFSPYAPLRLSIHPEKGQWQQTVEESPQAVKRLRSSVPVENNWLRRHRTQANI